MHGGNSQKNYIKINKRIHVNTQQPLWMLGVVLLYASNLIAYKKLRL